METTDGLVHVRPAGSKFCVGLAVLLAGGLAGCGTKKDAVVDPNVYPANYRDQVATLLGGILRDPADYRGALIAPPVLKPVGDSQHYIVCIALNGHNVRRNKVAIYLEGAINQYLDATPAQCADAAYQPFKELEQAKP